MFGLVNLPEVVKGALFARYSRSSKSLRRLFLDEFAKDVAPDGAVSSIGEARAEKLYERVFVEYGDDSVAQLGGVHLASSRRRSCWQGARMGPPGRVPRAVHPLHAVRRPAGHGGGHVPAEIEDTGLAPAYRADLDEVFGPTRGSTSRWTAHFYARFPQEPGDPDFVYRQTILAEDLDTLRLMLPVGTRSNLGIYAPASPTSSC